MEHAHFDADSKAANTINPADLHNGLFTNFNFGPYCAVNPPAVESPNLDLNTVDSAVDLTSFQEQWPPIKAEPLMLDQFFDLPDHSLGSNTPSPSTDIIFSQANSPGDFIRDQSQTSSPATRNDSLSQDVKPRLTDDAWNPLYATPDAIHIPQTVEPPVIYLCPDKTKTRAETQIRVQLILDPVDDRYVYMHFPRKTLAKPKLLASAEEKKDLESKGESIHMDLFLVCATAVEKPDRLDQALRRAAGKDHIPRRPTGVAIAELDKDDPAHPQNGGEVLICEGCKERERKRYDRKKKRAEDEDEWWSYEDDRVIMINEKEYKKWKDVESGDQRLSPSAKQVEFAMRIACYCRHQEEKCPVGYRVIFTFKDDNGNLVAQHTSEIFQITDDHKNKDPPPEAIPRPLSIPQQYIQTQYPAHPNVVPIYQYPVENQYPTSLGPYSQPPTPVMSAFQTPLSPMETQFPSSTATAATGPPPRQNPPTFSGTASTTPAPQFARPQSVYDAPMLSPTSQVPPDVQYLPRPVSMENFNFSPSMQYPHHQGFASAPPSAASTPINLSRPASPTWEQGPTKKRLHCVYFYVDED
ncbi:hypothetical protein K505DRAFT_323285 [Melanomma pulvis-pyrius CBS 109.77]|uniref:SPT23/MGA2-like DNA-binding domain-containing protein n=1 Tax=Melanomma pulvis-pyrius CBS 109.77 TaxID=1314802 RepID=A0A6A6XJ11_9PLEO|nr:hypothetical protein K505DRAFT_323285 [Melanomma pulvis-pyrius CBS 109.77]